MKEAEKRTEQEEENPKKLIPKHANGGNKFSGKMEKKSEEEDAKQRNEEEEEEDEKMEKMIFSRFDIRDREKRGLGLQVTVFKRFSTISHGFRPQISDRGIIHTFVDRRKGPRNLSRTTYSSAAIQQLTKL